MKALKILLKVIVCIIAIVILAILAMPLWFGPVVKGVANSTVPGIVKTEFHLGQLSLNPYSGRVELGDMQLANPAGYSEKYAVTLGSVAVDLGMMTLPTDVVHVEEITVKDVFVSVVSGGENNVLNFTQIQYNLAGGKEKYEAAQAEKEKEGEKAEEPESKEPGKKFIIDRLEISGLKIKLSVVPISLPSITLTDVGKESGGATMEEVWNAIIEAVTKAAGAVGDQLKALGGIAGDAAAATTKAVGDAAAATTKAVGDAAAATTEAVGNVAGGAADAAGKAASAVGDTAGKAVDAVGEGAGKAVDAVGDGAKAVGEGAKKAVDSLKSLF